MRSFVQAAAALLIGTALASTPANAEKYALLIGVGEYSSPKIDSLPAVANDLALMVEVSQRLEVQKGNMWLVASQKDSTKARAEGVNPVAPATRNGIITQLDRMVKLAKDGDQILIYYSGHGYQVPDQADIASGKDEADGLDEALAPSDTTTNENGIPLTTNLIIDDEIDDRIMKIRRQGASVWLVVDSCHSGTMSRSAAANGSTIQWKYLPRGTIGDRSAPAVDRRSTEQDRQFLQITRTEAAGALVAFYAVPPDVLAPMSQWYSEGIPSVEKYSLLTFAIHRALDRGGVTTYEQLGQAVTDIYNDQSPGDRQFRNPSGFRVLPQLDGEMGRPLLGSELVQARNWTVSESGGQLTLRAGLLRFINQGATINVYDAAAPNTKRLFEATSVTLTDAVLQPVDNGPLPTSRSLRGELVRNPVMMQTRVAVATAATSPLAGAAKSALDALARNPDAAIELGSGAGAADLIITPGADRVWIASPQQAPETLDPANPLQPVHVLCSDPAACQPLIEKRVSAMATASRLQRVLTTSATAAMPAGLQVETFVRRGSDTSESEACDPASQLRLSSSAEFRPYSIADGVNQGIRLSHCDEIYIRVSRADAVTAADADQAIDVTGLYFGADGVFSPLAYPQRSDAGGMACRDQLSLRPGECVIMFARVARTFRNGPQSPYGAEAIGLIAVTRPWADPSRLYTDIQSPNRRDAASDPFMQALHQAYNKPTTRSSAQPALPTAVMMIPIDFLPRENGRAAP